MSINKPLQDESRAAIKCICQRMISGEVSFVEGTRQVLDCAENARLEQDDADLIVFVGVASETDEVPGQEQLKIWNKIAAAKNAAKWAELERWARDYGSTACRNFVSRF